MRLSARALNRATLQRQSLLQRGPVTVVDAVSRAFAIQAQEPASPYLALWNRVARFDPAELDRAFADGTVVKSTLMRVTLHAVAADDHPMLHAVMRPRLRQSRINHPMFRTLGLTESQADDAFEQIRAFLAEPRANAEVRAALDDYLGELPDPGLWWALRMFTPVRHVPTGGPWSFGPRPSYRVAAVAAGVDPADATRHYVRRYLEAFGPASVADIAQFSLLLRPTVRAAIDELELRTYTGPSDETLYDLPSLEIPDAATTAPPRLMAMWDSTLFAYADRSRIVPPEFRPHVIRTNGDTLPGVLVNGYFAGVWRPVADGIEVSAFRPLPQRAWRSLRTEAGRLRTLLADRDPEVYRRYNHWWPTLPVVEARVL